MRLKDLLQEESSGAISSGNFEQHEANSAGVLSDKSFGEQSALLRLVIIPLECRIIITRSNK